MAIDQPLTVYPRHDDTAGKAEHTEAELDAVTEEWRERHGGGIIGRKVSLDELLGGGKRGQENN